MPRSANVGYTRTCNVLECKDGRVTRNSKKVTFGYHIVAREKFGDQLQKVASSKYENDLTISHICGTPLCL
jgi:hypothetical protein